MARAGRQVSAPPAGSRAAVLARIRASLGVTGEEPSRRAAVAARLAEHRDGVVPAIATGDAAERLSRFREKALAAAATLTDVASPADLPEAIARFLAGRNLPARLRHGDDPRLAGLAWPSVALEIATGRSDGGDLVGLSHAEAAIAETGTLMLVSGPDNPTTLNFLPETHIVVVDAGDVVGGLEDAMQRLRARYGPGEMPRTVNFVTGPSRSADIEQTLLYGAHGPRALQIFLVGAES
jgi:L-lactate dehydrogenase complex protein LldG